MIILSKKRFGIISTILLISLFVFVFQVASSKQTVQTVSLPVSNKVIVLDAGHGKPDEGAQSSNGTTEAEKNYIKSSKFVRAIWCNCCFNS